MPFDMFHVFSPAPHLKIGVCLSARIPPSLSVDRTWWSPNSEPRIRGEIWRNVLKEIRRNMKKYVVVEDQHLLCSSIDSGTWKIPVFSGLWDFENFELRASWCSREFLIVSWSLREEVEILGETSRELRRGWILNDFLAKQNNKNHVSCLSSLVSRLLSEFF